MDIYIYVCVAYIYIYGLYMIYHNTHVRASIATVLGDSGIKNLRRRPGAGAGLSGGVYGRRLISIVAGLHLGFVSSMGDAKMGPSLLIHRFLYSTRPFLCVMPLPL